MRIDPSLLGEQLMLKIKQALQNRLDFQNNFRAVILDVLDTGPADTPFVVTHNLGFVPTGYIANASAGVVTDYQRASWSGSILQLKCSQPNAAIKLVVF